MVFQDPYASLNPRMTVSDALAEAVQAHGNVRAGNCREKSMRFCKKSAFPRGRGANIPMNFPADSGNGLPSRARWPSGPNCWWPTNPCPRWTFPFRRKLSICWPGFRAKSGLTLIFISHDLSVVKHIADRIAVMYLGRIVEMGPAAAVIETPLHPYTKALISAIPIPDPRREKQRARIFLPGDPPSPLDPPNGCPFHPRCLYAIEHCAQVVPKLEPFGESGCQASCIRVKEINSSTSTPQ